MNLINIVKSSLRGFRARKLRSFLTMLGMIIGISGVIIIMSVGAGAQSLIIDQISSVGSNLVGVLPGAAVEDGPPASALGITVTTLTYDDALAISEKRNVHNLVEVASYVRGSGTVKYGNKDLNTTFTGTTANYLEVEDTELEFGRFFDEAEERGISRVVVLGSSVAEELFEGQDPVGKDIKVKKELFKVIGVIEERGTAFFVNQDDQIFIPVKTAQKILLGINHLNFIRAKVNDASNVDQTLEEIKMVLRDRHEINNPDEDDFSVRSLQQGIDVLTQVTDALKFFLVAIAGIALIVGGIGIMNIMLVAVSERIREVGLRKAVGAKKGSILFQFLVETIIISLVGGILGIIFGSAFSVVIALVARYLGYDWALLISVQSIVLSVSFSVIVGIIFGIYPALKAARLDPIDALHYE